MVEVEEFCEFYEWDNMTHSWTWDYDYVLGFWFCVGVFHFCVDSFFFFWGCCVCRESWWFSCLLDEILWSTISLEKSVVIGEGRLY